MATAGPYTRGGGDEASGGNGPGVMHRMGERAAAQLSAQKDKAIDGMGSVVQSVRQSTQQLREQRHETLASYVESVADQIDRLSQRLREKDIGELLDDAQRLARRRPGAFIGAAFGLGLLGARFLKSSAHDSQYSAHASQSAAGSNERHGYARGSGVAGAESRYAGAEPAIGQSAYTPAPASGDPTRQGTARPAAGASGAQPRPPSSQASGRGRTTAPDKEKP